MKSEKDYKENLMNTKIFAVNDYFISMQIIASASVDMSGLMYMYIIMSLPYMYSVHVCQFEIVWPVFLKAIASLCNKMGKVFSS